MRVSVSPRGALKLKPDSKEERQAFRAFASVFDALQTGLLVCEMTKQRPTPGVSIQQ
ncbi:unnamed protein product, partial [marine sediment metagenome]